jgi:hypothetical protein
MWKCKDCDYRNTMTGGIVVKGRRGEACIICGAETVSRNLCSHHYQQLARAERAKKREEARIAFESEMGISAMDISEETHPKGGLQPSPLPTDI